MSTPPNSGLVLSFGTLMNFRRNEFVRYCSAGPPKKSPTTVMSIYCSLLLPIPKTVPSNPTIWIDDAGFTYPSDRIFIRQSYEDIARLLLEHAASKPTDDGANMVLSGPSGTGKSFFSRYFVWRLLHPTGGGKVPETIVCRHTQGGFGGWMYHRGRFYMINKVHEFVSDAYAHILLHSKDAWLIFDGEPSHDNLLSKCLVISSPGNLHQNFTHVKQYRKGNSLFRVYLPTWTVEELWEVSRVIHGSDADKLDDIVDRFEMFGGIARYVLQEGYAVNNPVLIDPIKAALNIKSVLKVVNEVGTEDVDQTKTSGVLIHLIPAEGCLTMRYEWGSFNIMEKAFNEVFKFEKDKIQTFLTVGAELPTGTLFGILFEPWFHTRVSQQGYTGRFRKLTTGRELAENKKKKRNLVGKTKDNMGIKDHTIPASPRNRFLELDQIIENRYNVPANPNFPAIDSIWPSRGEMYQLTSAEHHEIKTETLLVLRQIFSNWLATNKTVKLIFVVPPSRFETYTLQQYVEPKSRKDAKGAVVAKEVVKEFKTDEQKVLAKKKSAVKLSKVVENEDVESGHRRKLRSEKSKASFEDEVDPSTATVDWIEQFVLEMDVNPLHEAMSLKAQEEPEKKKSRMLNPLNFIAGKK